MISVVVRCFHSELPFENAASPMAAIVVDAFQDTESDEMALSRWLSALISVVMRCQSFLHDRHDQHSFQLAFEDTGSSDSGDHPKSIFQDVE
jgi:hypothetical protein